MEGFEKLLDLFQKHYYGDFVLAMVEIIAIIAGLMYARKDPIGKVLIGYIILDLLVLLGGWWILCFSNFRIVKEYNFIDITNSLISLVELLSYYYFFSKVLTSKRALKVLKVQAIIFTVLFFFLMTIRVHFLFGRFAYASNLLSVIGFFFLLIPCGFYFIKLLTDNPTENLFNRPSFWITTGIFSYSLFSIPYYLIDRLLIGNNYPYRYIISSIFFFMPFTINFTFLIRAFLCKRALTT
jgi:hypothetical protein